MMPRPMPIAQIPARRLRIKRDVGWFPAGLEVATALEVLSDAAFKLYVFLCLNADRHSGRMVWAPQEIANQLRRDCQSVGDALANSAGRESVCAATLPLGGPRQTGSRWKSATVSGPTRRRRWRSSASTSTIMCSRSGK